MSDEEFRGTMFTCYGRQAAEDLLWLINRALNVASPEDPRVQMFLEVADSLEAQLANDKP